MTEPFIIRYRPTKWDEVIGNEETVRSLRKVLDENSSHAFLFTGPSGTGKTTLARLAAKEVGTTDANIVEIDAATYNGIDEMRGITEQLIYRPLGVSNIKSVIMDECHALTRQAWQSLLKMVEEPPTGVYWFFCTTDVTRVPETIQTRCSVYTLYNLNLRQLTVLLTWVLNCEDRKLDPSIIDLCVKEALGSPRRALSHLGQTINCTSREEAYASLGRISDEADQPVALARALVNGAKWPVIQAILIDLRDENPEKIRKVVLSYVTKVILDNKDESTLWSYLPLLDEFSQPINYSDGISPIVLACTRIVFATRV
jgi:DNA polymerase III subunit gamma/tau